MVDVKEDRGTERLQQCVYIGDKGECPRGERERIRLKIL